jgi:hypothetical protein
MSMMGPLTNGRGEVGDTVATFPSYEAAQKAVSALIAADVPAKDIAIVGTGLRSVEKVTGRLGYAAAARSGAINGVLLGLLFAAIFVLGTPDVAIQLFVGVLFVGIALGMLMSIIAYSLVRRRRDYASITQVVADHYDVTVLPASIHRARQALGRPADATPTAAAAPAAGAPAFGERTPAVPAPEYGERLADPPRYGERVAPTPSDEGRPGAAGENPDAPHEHPGDDARQA